MVPHLPRLWARLQQTRRAVRARRPHLVVGIDSKGFNLRLLGALARERAAAGRASGGGGGAPTPALVQYVAPSAWAFEDAEARASRLAGTLDELLLLLPFEKELFSRAGVRCTFVGHPTLEAALPYPPGDLEARRRVGREFRSEHGLGAEVPLLCLLPGSRAHEVRAMLPPMLRAARLVRDELAPAGTPPAEGLRSNL